MGGVRRNARENGEIRPSTNVWDSSGAACQHLASVLQESRNRGIFSSGVIWGIPLQNARPIIQFKDAEIR